MTKARDIATSTVTTADLTAEVGSTIQAHDADLDTISGLAKTDGNVIVGDGANWVAEDPATVRTSLGLGTAATTAATDYATAAQASVGTKNRIINGNFDVWQRGTSFTITASTNTYTADRWRFVGSAFTGTLTRQSFTPGQTDVPNNPDYFASWDVTTNAAGNVGFAQYIENVRTLAGKTATVSLYLKSNSTIAANTLNLRYRHVTGGTGGSSTSVNIGEITTSWQKFTFTINIPSLSGATLGASNSSYLAMDIISPTAHTSAFQLDIAQVQVEEGDTATPFENRMYSTELAMCERYFQKNYLMEDAPGVATSGENTRYMHGSSDGSSNGAAGVFWRGRMRATPTVTWYTDGGTQGQWNYARSGASGTGSFIAYRVGDTGANGYMGVGVAWSPCSVWGNWTANAEL